MTLDNMSQGLTATEPESRDSWLLKTTGLDEATREARVRELPLLPQPRPRALTPPGFSLAVATQGLVPLAAPQESSPYFKTPPELRREILLLAFGNRRLHLRLSYEHPDASKKDPDNHCGIVFTEPEDDRRVSGLDKPPMATRLFDIDQPKAWRWWGAVCHRLIPNFHGTPMTRGGCPGPWLDECRNGNAKHCEKWRGVNGDTAPCYIGVLGWLLSCRRK
jgi:hypothetical protein